MHRVTFHAFAGLPVDADINLGHVYRTDGDTLAAIMPIAQRLIKGRPTEGGIYIAESSSGLDFGPPVVLKSPDVYLRRTADMPVHYVGGHVCGNNR